MSAYTPIPEERRERLINGLRPLFSSDADGAYRELTADTLLRIATALETLAEQGKNLPEPAPAAAAPVKPQKMSLRRSKEITE